MYTHILRWIAGPDGRAPRPSTLQQQKSASHDRNAVSFASGMTSVRLAVPNRISRQVLSPEGRPAGEAGPLP